MRIAAIAFAQIMLMLVSATGTRASCWAEYARRVVCGWPKNGTRSETLAQTRTAAKNVILFVGDGMGISTVTAARILEGQLRGESGEENQLSFEKFPYVALSKTYTVDQQTQDSAPTMTAMVTGVKTNDRTISVDQFVKFAEPDGAIVKQHALKTVLEMAEEKGLSTGVVTTTRVTHATPACLLCAYRGA